MNKKRGFARLVGAGAVIAIIVLVCIFTIGTESWQRSFKSFKSDISGGLDRTVSVYSYDGDLIREWSGKFDVDENDNEVFFDVNGKRVIIQGGIVINEEN